MNEYHSSCPVCYGKAGGARIIQLLACTSLRQPRRAKVVSCKHLCCKAIRYVHVVLNLEDSLPHPLCN